MYSWMNEWGRLDGVAMRRSLGRGGGPAFSYCSVRISKSRRLLEVLEVLGVGEGERLLDIHRTEKRDNWFSTSDEGGDERWRRESEVDGKRWDSAETFICLHSVIRSLLHSPLLYIICTIIYSTRTFPEPTFRHPSDPAFGGPSVSVSSD